MVLLAQIAALQPLIEKVSLPADVVVKLRAVSRPQSVATFLAGRLSFLASM